MFSSSKMRTTTAPLSPFATLGASAGGRASGPDARLTWHRPNPANATAESPHQFLQSEHLSGKAQRHGRQESVFPERQALPRESAETTQSFSCPSGRLPRSSLLSVERICTEPTPAFLRRDRRGPFLAETNARQLCLLALRPAQETAYPLC